MPISPGAGSTDQAKDSTVNSPQTGGASPSTLAGQDADGAGQAPSDTDEGLKQVVQQVRQMQVGMMDLAKQFPAAASSFRQAAEGLRAGLRQIIANPSSPEPASPNVGG